MTRIRVLVTPIQEPMFNTICSIHVLMPKRDEEEELRRNCAKGKIFNILLPNGKVPELEIAFLREGISFRSEDMKRSTPDPTAWY